MHASRLKPSIDLPSVDAPIIPEFKPGEFENRFAWRDCRDNAPYKPGDVIWCMIYSGREYRPKKCVVERVFAEYRQTSEMYIEKYRIRNLNADGKSWSGRWRYAYPGFIERAYEEAAKEARKTEQG